MIILISTLAIFMIFALFHNGNLDILAAWNSLEGNTGLLTVFFVSVILLNQIKTDIKIDRLENENEETKRSLRGIIINQQKDFRYRNNFEINSLDDF